MFQDEIYCQSPPDEDHLSRDTRIGSSAPRFQTLHSNVEFLFITVKLATLGQVLASTCLSCQRNRPEPASEFERFSMGQKEQREKETKENQKVILFPMVLIPYMFDALLLSGPDDSENLLPPKKDCLPQMAIKLRELSGINSGRAYNVLLQNQAETHLLKSEYAEARSIHARIIGDTATSHDVWGLLTIAQIDIMMGADKVDVCQTLDRVKALVNPSQSNNFDTIPAGIYCDIESGELHLREGEVVDAKAKFRRRFRLTWGNDAQATLSCIKGLADVSHWPESDFDSASGWAVVYLGYTNKLENKLALHQALQFIGDVFQAQDDSTTATALFTVALDGFTHMDIHRGRAECLLRLRNLAKGQGDAPKAIEIWGPARPLFERSSQVKRVPEIDEGLAAITDVPGEHHTDRLTFLVQLNTPSTAIVT
ncbi:hypothetical protein FB451DRAFT_1192377 [Mycena latifolia]|nr:hypothetical protein FB451DRAFT_1192377 [Mycena latifolia]